MPHACAANHQPHGQSGYAQASDIEIAAKEIQRMKVALEGVLAHHTGQDIEKIATDTERDFIMTAEEAKAYGVIDDVIDARTGERTDGPIAPPK
ncbi:MAG: ATP-dependent Clp protease proteolytic subunit [Microthrixaceae bacterium]